MEFLESIGLNLLQTIIIALAVLVGRYAIKFINAKAKQLQESTESSYINNVIGTISQLVEKVVSFVSQTYVSNLKKDGLFDIEEQGIAFDMAFERVVKLVSEEYHDVVEAVFGNFSDFVETLIEAAVADKKPQEELPAEIVL